MRHLLSSAALAVVMAGAPTLASAQSGSGCPDEFPVADSNQDGMISGKEASAAMLQEFSLLDADDSGTISKEEWRACGQAGMHSMIDAKAADLQAGDHAPRQEEGADMRTMMDAGPSDLQAGDHAPTQEQGEQMHTMMDAERSGVQAGDHAPMQKNSLSAAQGAAPLNQEGPPRPWWSGDRPFQRADKDNSGSVSRAEAATAAKSSYEKSPSGKAPEAAARESGARFAVLDRNGDGAISQREWKNRDQADMLSLFSRLDQNNDGKLTKSEFHQATDRGPASDEPVTIWYYYTY